MRDDFRFRIAVLSLHTSPAAAPGRGASGGLNVYVRELCRALAARGVASDVLVRVGAGSPTDPLSFAPGCRLLPVAVGREGDLTRDEERALVPELARAVAHVLDRGEYAATWSHYWVSGAVVLATGSRLPRPWLHAGHTWAAMKNASLAPGAAADPAWREAIEWDVITEADLVLAASESECAFLRSFGIDGERCAVTTPGVDVATFHPGRTVDAPSSPYFVVVGRLERLKGVELALAGLAELPRGAARLAVVGADSGEPGERGRLGARASALGIGDFVDFTGPVGRGELRAYYANAAGCLFPSYSETFGLVALEALACGTPLVTSRAAGVASLLEDGVSGLLVQPPGYGAAMRRLLDDEALGARLGAAGRQVALAHTWEASAATWLEEVEPLLALRPVRA
ncbi:MAG: glycosyltransferase [Candidatus Dormiibacterota bacterium]